MASMMSVLERRKLLTEKLRRTKRVSSMNREMLKRTKSVHMGSKTWLTSVTSGKTEVQTWWRHQMEAVSASLVFYAGNSPVAGEFPSQRQGPVTRSFDVFFDLRLNKRLSKQPVIWEAIAPIMTSLQWQLHAKETINHSIHQINSLPKTRANSQKIGFYLWPLDNRLSLIFRRIM